MLYSNFLMLDNKNYPFKIGIKELILLEPMLDKGISYNMLIDIYLMILNRDSEVITLKLLKKYIKKNKYSNDYLIQFFKDTYANCFSNINELRTYIYIDEVNNEFCKKCYVLVMNRFNISPNDFYKMSLNEINDLLDEEIEIEEEDYEDEEIEEDLNEKYNSYKEISQKLGLKFPEVI